eukprot:scaffold26118_cov29-Tisochrysis_lutea.AAC.1
MRQGQLGHLVRRIEPIPKRDRHSKRFTAPAAAQQRSLAHYQVGEPRDRPRHRALCTVHVGREPIGHISVVAEGYTELRERCRQRLRRGHDRLTYGVHQQRGKRHVESPRLPEHRISHCTRASGEVQLGVADTPISKEKLASKDESALVNISEVPEPASRTTRRILSAGSLPLPASSGFNADIDESFQCVIAERKIRERTSGVSTRTGSELLAFGKLYTGTTAAATVGQKRVTRRPHGHSRLRPVIRVTFIAPVHRAAATPARAERGVLEVDAGGLHVIRPEGQLVEPLGKCGTHAS